MEPRYLIDEVFSTIIIHPTTPREGIASMATDTRELAGADKRVDASEKRLINCHQVDVNQLMPLKYNWAWELSLIHI